MSGDSSISHSGNWTSIWQLAGPVAGSNIGHLEHADDAITVDLRRPAASRCLKSNAAQCIGIDPPCARCRPFEGSFKQA